MSDVIKLLIAPWGNPREWNPAKYVIRNKEYLSKTSTLPLLEHVKPNALVVIALDTLAPLVFGSQPKDIKSYLDIVHGVEEEIRRRLDNFINEFVEDSRRNEISIDEEAIRRVDKRIVIAPGAGTFYPRKDGEYANYPYRFEGPMIDFYNIVLYELSRIMLGYLTPESTVQLHLDLTHGINYMPTLTYRAVAHITSILALTHTTELHVYNAEPYPPGWRRIKSQELPRLFIHLVERRDVAPEVPIEWPEDPNEWGPGRSLDTDDQNLKAEINKILGEKYKLIMLECDERVSLSALCFDFTLAVRDGIPLLLVYTWNALSRGERGQLLYNMIREIYDLWLKNIRVDSNALGVSIVRKVRFTKTFTTYVSVWFMHNVLSNIMSLEDVKFTECSEDIAFLVKLRYLDKLYEDLYSRLGLELSAVVWREISNVKRDVKDYVDKKPGEVCKTKLYSEIAKELGKQEKLSPEFDLRNFIAHSGLLYNIVGIHLSKIPEDTEIGYYRKNIALPISEILKKVAEHAKAKKPSQPKVLR